MFRTLIQPATVAEHLDDPAWVIVDCRFDLARSGWGRQAWAQGHIPGAQYAHLDLDLSGARAAHCGRHPLPQPAALAATLGRLGIGAASQVIAYDQGNGAFAARLWWLLHWLGHHAAAVLDGGFAAWQRAGLPVSATAAGRRPRQFSARPDAGLIASTAQIEALQRRGALGGEVLLVDARAADRFAGHNETLDPVAGHIPGAINRPLAGNLDGSGRLLPAEVLRAQWLATLAGRTPAQVISMCGSGVTACHNLLALAVAGLDGARLYPGSWSEWITDPRRAVAADAGSLL